MRLGGRSIIATARAGEGVRKITQNPLTHTQQTTKPSKPSPPHTCTKPTMLHNTNIPHTHTRAPTHEPNEYGHNKYGHGDAVPVHPHTPDPTPTPPPTHDPLASIPTPPTSHATAADAPPPPRKYCAKNVPAYPTPVPSTKAHGVSVVAGSAAIPCCASQFSSWCRRSSVR